MDDAMGRMMQRSGEVFAAPLEERTLLLNVATGRYHGLNPVAARIWELLAEPRDEAQLVALLLDEFEVAPDTCRAEVAAFLDGLRGRGLLTEA